MPSASLASPRLAPPGAGLPRPELLVANLIFRGGRLFTSRATAQARLSAECQAIVGLAAACDPVDGARPVLIPRLRGMEDSSRNWSVFMTLEHLRIVNAAIADVIGQLARGELPPRPASTAAVKPSPGVGAGVIKTFSGGCTELARAAAAVADLRTPARFAHPWFGPLDAAGWHFMAGFHLRLHRRQVISIIRRLDTDASRV